MNKSPFGRLVWRGFVNSRPVRIASLTVVFIVLVASILGIIKYYSVDTEEEVTITRANYQHKGDFKFDVYYIPNSIYGEPPPQAIDPEPEEYFAKIIDSISLGYDYEFTSEEPVNDVTAQIHITGIVSKGTGWEKETTLLNEIHNSSRCNIRFPLYLDQLTELANTITGELGLAARGDTFIDIKADVEITGRSGNARIEDELTQITSLQIQQSGTILSWDSDLTEWKDGNINGIEYEHQGEFSYDIKLKPNTLYGDVTLHSPSQPERIPTPPPSLAPGPTYFTRLIDSTDADFSYQFMSDQPVKSLQEELEVTATLSSTKLDWSKSFTLIPRTSKTGAFKIPLEINLDEYLDLVDTIRGEVGGGGSENDLRITASVHTVAQTEYGQIDDYFTHSMGGKISGFTIKWDSNLDEAQSGKITETIIQDIPGARSDWTWSFWTLAIAIVAGAYLITLLTLVRPAKPPVAEAEAIQAKRKFKDTIVDIQTLPSTKPGEILVQFSQLEELIKTGDALLKPVFHEVTEGRHTYCVIDGLMRYQYENGP